ncbi:hypothetical protein CS0771_69050 [Catellatospora sp. IY07-71]|nr:hypothetical protein CS0771_69050 [Catellatospora sp. IY07-71]
MTNTPTQSVRRKLPSSTGSETSMQAITKDPFTAAGTAYTVMAVTPQKAASVQARSGGCGVRRRLFL